MAIEVPRVEHPKHGFDELNEVIKRDLGRRIVVVGACIGTDSHTTGIDAIMNMKGFAGDYGLERYPMFRAINLGSQVEPAALAARAKAEGADAILVSKVVTQRDVHKEDARALIEAAKEQGIFGKTIFLFGGPRVDHKTALELGFDAGFGPAEGDELESDVDQSANYSSGSIDLQITAGFVTGDRIDLTGARFVISVGRE